MEPLVHLAVPFAINSLLGLRLRWALVAGLVGIMPDLDVLFSYIDRSATR
ncbi:MAG: hypothetical protein H3Z50_07320 [archaeon]|nr:hypothetical protein [archaeon]MCP8306671.1 hypothetical protein [archaeon]